MIVCYISARFIESPLYYYSLREIDIDICVFQVVGANGSPNTEKKVRLQLFYPPFAFKAKPDQLDVSSHFFFCVSSQRSYHSD